MVALSHGVFADPLKVSTDFPLSSQEPPVNKPILSEVVSIFQNQIATYAIPSSPQNAEKFLSQITISPAAESLIPAGSLKNREPEAILQAVQALVEKNPDLVAEIVVLAIREMGMGMVSETIVEAALKGLHGPQTDLKPIAMVLALLAADEDANVNASSLIAANQILITNGVIPADSSLLTSLLVKMGVLAVGVAPVSIEGSDSGNFSGDQGVGNVGSTPSGGSSGGAESVPSPTPPAPTS